MLLKLYLYPSLEPQIRKPQQLKIEPETPLEEFLDEFGNRVGRVLLPEGRVRLFHEAVVEDGGEPDPVATAARQLPVEALPAAVLPYLLPSRYCEVDLLSEVAWKLFGDIPAGWGRVQGICDWVHSHIRFGYEHARPTKTAYEVYQERSGVCRDFMHLAVTFCRCLNIPARCAAGYLGDLDIPPVPQPMDFSAWFEVYLDHRWYTFDARYNIPRQGRVLMVRGRDAVDLAFTTAFAPVNFQQLRVWTDEARG